MLPSAPLPESPARGTLVVLTGTSAGRLAVVGRRGVVVGRGDGADLVVDDDAVSRRHARVGVGPDAAFFVEDLDSMNGTFVSGRRVTLSTLVAGDSIQLGPQLKLRFSLGDEADESLQRKLYESSVRDPLTHAFNRAYFADRLSVELAIARRAQGEVSLLMIDLDGLKEINDRHGHLAGDRALSFVAARIASATRAGHLLARYGGDEFVILAALTSLHEALVLAERVRRCVAELCFAAGGEPVVMSVSIGVASVGEVAAGVPAGEGLVALADERLYAAKRAGKNRVRPLAVVT
jgi:diguanylate cyclase (GGDEF)-like protein